MQIALAVAGILALYYLVRRGGAAQPAVQTPAPGPQMIIYPMPPTTTSKPPPPPTPGQTGNPVQQVAQIVGTVTAAAGVVSAGATALGLTGGAGAAAAGGGAAAVGGAAAGEGAAAGGSAAAAGTGAAASAPAIGAAAPIAIAGFVVWNAVDMILGGPDYGTELPPPFLDNDANPIDKNRYIGVHRFGTVSSGDIDPNASYQDGFVWPDEGGWAYVPIEYTTGGTRKDLSNGVRELDLPNGMIFQWGGFNPVYPAIQNPEAFPPGTIIVKYPPDAFSVWAGGASGNFDSTAGQILAHVEWNGTDWVTKRDPLPWGDYIG